MKAGMVLGIIGGVISLIIGAVGYGATSTLSSIANAVGDSGGSSSMAFYSFASIALPIIGLVGAGIVYRSTNLAIALMALSAVGTVTIFGFGVMSLIPTVLLGLGAVLVALDKDKGPYSQS